MANSAIRRPLKKEQFRKGERFVPLTQEKIIGINNLLNIAWLSRGLELARSVARVVTPEGIGTGFLIAPDLLLTNNHVLSSADVAAQSQVEFNYQKDWSGQLAPVRTYKLDPTHSRNFRTNPEDSLDYTLVRVAENPGELFGYIDPWQFHDPAVNDYVTVIQHPNGGPKQIALTDNKVASVFAQKVQYTTDTEPGSSGSPVFDQEWRLVGLHHAGGDMRAPDGRSSSYVNEGILISQILQDARVFLGKPDEMYDVVFSDLRSDLTTVVASGLPMSQIPSTAAMLTMSHPRFPLALHDWTRTHAVGKDAKREIAPLLAAAVGVAAGAAIRHWARSSGHEAIERVGASEGLPTCEGLTEMIAPRKHGMPNEIYDGVLADILRQPDLVRPVLRVQGIGDAEVLPVIAAAFLAGVLVGAKAYDGAKK